MLRSAPLLPLLVLAAAAPAQSGAATETAADRLSALLAKATARAAESLDRTDIWEDHSNWANAWVARSKHYEVRTTASYAYAKRVGTALDNSLRDFQNLLGKKVVPPSRVPVEIYPTIDAYNTFANEHGAELSTLYGAFYAAASPNQAIGAAWIDQDWYLQMGLTNAAFHHWLTIAFPGTRADTWVVEGLACYLETTVLRNYTIEQFKAQREANKLLPLTDLLRRDLGGYSVDDIFQRRIQLAVFFDYLLRHRPDTRTLSEQNAPFRDLIVALLEGRAPEGDLFESMSSREGLAELQQEFHAFEF